MRITYSYSSDIPPYTTQAGKKAEDETISRFGFDRVLTLDEDMAKRFGRFCPPILYDSDVLDLIREYETHMACADIIMQRLHLELRRCKKPVSARKVLKTNDRIGKRRLEAVQTVLRGFDYDGLNPETFARRRRDDGA